MEQFINWLVNVLTDFFGFIGGAITWFFDAVMGFVRAVGDLLWQIVGALWEHVLMPVLLPIALWIWDQISPVLQPIFELIEIVRLVVEVIISVFGVVMQYVGEAVTLFFAIINGMAGAPPTPIPGLPRCISAPLESQVCALWYMIDWTLIADDTPGARIVPIIVLMIDLVIVVYLVKSVFRIAKMWQSMFAEG